MKLVCPSETHKNSKQDVICEGPHPVLRGLFLAVVVLLVYLPSYRAGFIWDDDLMAANELVKGGGRGLYDIWFSTKFLDFVPLTSSSFWIEWQLWGPARLTQHATNIVLHAANVVLLWRVLLCLRIPGAWLAALVFGVHPVCVASVTWVAERKNTLSMLFYFASLLFYLRFDQSSEAAQLSGSRTSARTYLLSLFAFVLGLLSKTSVVVLPAVFWLCAWWERGRVSRQDVFRVIPFLVSGFLMGMMTLTVHHETTLGQTVDLTNESLLVRSIGGSWAIGFYFQKLLLPFNLTMHYPRWEVAVGSWTSYLPGMAILGLLLVCWSYRRTWGKPCLFGMAYFIIALSPTLGVVNMAYLTYSRVADHFQYLAMPGVLALLVAGGGYAIRLLLSKADIRQALLAPASLVAVGILILLCVRHQRLVGNPEALWRDNLRLNPKSWPARNNLGQILSEHGKFKEAEEHCRVAVAVKPDASESFYNLGNALFRQGKCDEAIEAFSQAVKISPKDSTYHNNLGAALQQKGRSNEAFLAFEQATRHNPRNWEAYCNLAQALANRGRLNEALDAYRTALRIAPNDPSVHDSLGRILAMKDDFNEAFKHFSHAIALKPEFADAHANLGMLLLRKGKLRESLESYAEAVRLNPDNPAFHDAFAEALGQAGNVAAATEHRCYARQLMASRNAANGESALAIGQWQEAIKLKPESPDLLNNLAWYLATCSNASCHDGAQAVRLAEKACALTNATSSMLDTLAAAYAEAGRFEDAIKAEQRAIELVENSGDKSRAQKLRSRLNLYKANQPFRE